MVTKREPKQSPGAAMVAAIVAEMGAVGCEPNATEQVLLEVARKLVDRMNTLEQVVSGDGLMLTSPTGVLRVHPAAVEHRQLAASLARVLGGIVIGDSSSGVPKNPAKVRAAQARWSRRDQVRETQARRFEGA
jgi:hypothetical protein